MDLTLALTYRGTSGRGSGCSLSCVDYLKVLDDAPMVTVSEFRLNRTVCTHEELNTGSASDQGSCNRVGPDAVVRKHATVCWHMVHLPLAASTSLIRFGAVEGERQPPN